jgi:zinc transport system ATP-binding protein
MTRATPHEPVAELIDAVVEIGGRPVLRGINLAVPAGQVVTILGANGSGKTTIIRALLGLTSLASGSARLFGQPVAKFRDRCRIGFVPQRPAVGAGVPATITEIVASGRIAHRRLLVPPRRQDRTAVADAIERVGLTARASDSYSSLSGGMQQRVLIARALAGTPDLFVMDEPTAGVDLANQVAMAATLRPLVATGATVVLVAHELGPMAELIDRAILVRDGRIVHDGDPLSDDALDEFHSHHHLGTQRDNIPLQPGGWSR